MGILSSIKNLFMPKAKEATQKLGVDSAIVDKLEELLAKLDGSGLNLSDSVTGAESALKEGIAGFKNGGLDLSALIEKAKGLLGGLEGIELPAEISGIVNAVKGLLGK